MTQEKVDEIFSTRFGNGPLKECRNDCSKIKRAIKLKLGIDVSISEAEEFWSFRSRDWDASWLVLPSDEEIAKYFIKMFNQYWKDDEENE
jgi:hypothetical protein